MPQISSMTALASRLLDSAKVIDTYLDENGLPPLSIDVDAHPEFPVPPSEKRINNARQAIFDLCETLTENVRGPRDVLIENAWSGHHLSSAMRAISHFKLWENVPESRSISFEEIAAKTRPPRTLSAPTGLNLAYNTDLPMFQWYALGDQEVEGRLEQLAQSMRFWANGEGFSSAENMIHGFDWGSLPKNALAVDVGGGPGQISIALAEAFPNLRLLVQDLPGQVNHSLPIAKEQYPDLISSGRLSYKPVDFLEPPPSYLPGASVSVYFLRHILHDWNDHFSIQILRILINSGKLKPGGYIVLADSVMPPLEVVSHMPRTVVKIMRRMDMQMLTILGSHERTL